MQPSGRVIVLGGGRRALEGFTRSLGKEIGPSRGATVNLIHVEEGAEDQLGATLRFFLTPRSAYVSGQVAHVGPGHEVPLAGRRALVTGASRGIGAAIAEVLEREGASVVRLDLKDADLELDITDADAPERIAAHFGGRLDILVHNAGVTKDRTLAKMPEDRWQSLMEVNLLAPERITVGAVAEAVQGRADRLRLLDERDRGQRRADQLRDVQGGAARPRERPEAHARHHDQRRRARVHRDGR